jgi:hypothetical protein|tara:strand:+ start:1584 stop:2186 length:603 start_codon:yes stop_codon:yes gene_type:complete
VFGKDFKYKIWDDLMEPNFRYDFDQFTNKVAWNLTNRANGMNHQFPDGVKGSHLFWGKTFFEINRESGKITSDIPDHVWGLQEWVFQRHLNENLGNRKFNFHYIGLNGQSLGQDGTVHVDGDSDEHYTLMYFVNDVWEKDWGGDFELIGENNQVIDKIEFVPGRLIFFKSNIPHRGLGPLKPMVVRKTLVWRGHLSNNNE